MTVFVVEINGRAVAAFGAGSQSEAEALVNEGFLHEDLMTLKNDGRPLWDGSSEVFIREADPSEVAKWEASYARARLADEADEEDRARWFAFLVSVTDPTGE